MKRITTLVSCFAIYLALVAGCTGNVAGKLDGDEIIHFIEENKSTSNEYVTVEAARKKFQNGLIVTDAGLKALVPYLTKETPESWSYHITLIQNKELCVFGDLVVEKNTGQITKSEFIAKKYRL